MCALRCRFYYYYGCCCWCCCCCLLQFRAICEQSTAISEVKNVLCGLMIPTFTYVAELRAKEWDSGKWQSEKSSTDTEKKSKRAKERQTERTKVSEKAAIAENLVETYNFVHSSHHKTYSLCALFFHFNSCILCISRALLETSVRM